MTEAAIECANLCGFEVRRALEKNHSASSTVLQNNRSSPRKGRKQVRSAREQSLSDKENVPRPQAVENTNRQDMMRQINVSLKGQLVHEQKQLRSLSRSSSVVAVNSQRTLGDQSAEKKCLQEQCTSASVSDNVVPTLYFTVHTPRDPPIAGRKAKVVQAAVAEVEQKLQSLRQSTASSLRQSTASSDSMQSTASSLADQPAGEKCLKEHCTSDSASDHVPQPQHFFFSPRDPPIAARKSQVVQAAQFEVDTAKLAGEYRKVTQDVVEEQFAGVQDALQALQALTLRNEQQLHLHNLNLARPCSCKEEFLELRGLTQTRLMASRVVNRALLTGLMNCMSHEQEQAVHASVRDREDSVKMCAALSAEVVVLKAAAATACEAAEIAHKQQVAKHEQVLVAKETSEHVLRLELKKARMDAATSKMEVGELLRAQATVHDELRRTQQNLEGIVSQHAHSDAIMEAEVCALRKQKFALLQSREENVIVMNECLLSHKQDEANICSLTQECSNYRAESARFENEAKMLRQSLKELQEGSKSTSLVQALMDSVSSTSVSEKTSLVPDLRVRNSQLLCTLEELKQQSHMLAFDNQSLQQTVKTFEDMFEDADIPSSKFTCDLNHEQKRKHTMQLKAENLKLKDRVRDLQRDLCNLQTSSCTNVLDALPSVSCLLQAGTSQDRSSKIVDTTCQDTNFDTFLWMPRVSKHHRTPPQKIETVIVDGTCTVVDRTCMPPQRLETVGSKLCKPADMAVEGVIQDFRHAQLLIERATADFDNVQCQDFNGLLIRLRSIVAFRCHGEVKIEAHRS